MKNRLLVLFFALVCILSSFGCSAEYLVKRVSQKVNTYTIEANFFEEDYLLEVNQTVNYKNRTGQALEYLKFNLHTQAFSKGATNRPVSSLNEQKAYPNGKSYGDMSFSKVEVNQKEADYALEEIDKNILNIDLGTTLKPGASIEVYMSYTLKLPNIHHRFGYGENTINLGNFYPIVCVYEEEGFVIQPYSSNGDPFYSDIANYFVTFTYPKNYTLASTGELTLKEELVDLDKSTIKALAVRDFAAVLSDKFELLKGQVDDIEVLYYYYEDTDPSYSLETAQKALKTFNKLIGKYPYKTLSVVQTNFVHGGMEYPNLVYISDALGSYSDYLNVIIHEIAHQWWYAVVGNNAFTCGWMDEGLTEYTTLLFYEQHPEYEVEKEEIISNALVAYNMFIEVYEEIFGKVDTSLVRTLGEYKTEPEYVYMAYVKSMLLFDNLRQTLGDARFFRALRDYYSKYKMQNVTPEQLISSFEKSTARKLNGWFNSWLNGDVFIREIN